MSTYVNIEILQSIPFSNANRDDANQPKVVRVGGTSRGRLSSQSLKRAARFYGASAEKGFGIKNDSSGAQYFRTRYLKSLVTDELIKRDLNVEDYDSRIEELLGKSLGKKGKDKEDKKEKIDKLETLIVLTKEEIEKLTDLVVSDEKIEDNSIKEILINSSKRDIALWGRFFASSNGATLDGSAQVAHAFTTHATRVEDDFFVGLDDASHLYSDHAGAGHPGNAFYLNGVFYKYANVNIEETLLNIGNARVERKEVVFTETDENKLVEETQFAIAEFLRSFSLSVPQGKIRSTAHTTLPEYIRISLTEGRPINASTAFDKAVEGNDLMGSSIKTLEQHNDRLKKVFGHPVQEIIVKLSDDDSLTLEEAIEEVKSSISSIVSKTYKNITE